MWTPETTSAVARQPRHLRERAGGGEAEQVVHGSGHGDVGRTPVAVEQLHAHPVAGGDVEDLGELPRDHQPLCRDRKGAAVLAHDAGELRRRGMAGQREPLAAVAAPDDGGGRAKGLDGEDAGNVGELLERLPRDGFGEGDGGVGPQRPLEGHRHQVVDRIDEEGAGHEDGHGRGDPEGAEEGARRPALEVAHRHPGGKGEERRQADPLDDGEAVRRRCRRPHGLGGRAGGSPARTAPAAPAAAVPSASTKARRHRAERRRR